MSATQELTLDGVRRGIDKLKASLANAAPEVAERLLQQLCEANAKAGETWQQAFSRMLRKGDDLAEAITVAHDAAFRARAAR
ncbi:MAG: hypothetical protein AB7P97_20875 [Hyphomonadaceae bacterium]